MAYPITPNSVVEFTVQGRANNQTCLSIFHYLYTGTSTLGDGSLALDNLVSVLNASGNLVGKLIQCIASNCNIDQLRAQWIFPIRYVYNTYAPYATFGAFSGTCNAPNAAAALEKRSDRAGRSNRGTLHIWGVAQEAMSAGRLGGSYTVAMQALATPVQGSVTVSSGITYDPIIYNRRSPALSPVIRGCVVHDTIRTMRRRTVGLGI